jgi:hypothetical protein
MSAWSSRVIDELAELKAQGYDFQEAWRAAMQEHPPRGRDRGMRAPALFDDERHVEPVESPVEFLKRACEDAWRGRRPVLRYLTDLWGLGQRDESEFVHPTTRRAA